jgi:hypothetical protein
VRHRKGRDRRSDGTFLAAVVKRRSKGLRRLGSLG